MYPEKFLLTFIVVIKIINTKTHKCQILILNIKNMKNAKLNALTALMKFKLKVDFFFFNKFKENLNILLVAAVFFSCFSDLAVVVWVISLLLQFYSFSCLSLYAKERVTGKSP